MLLNANVIITAACLLINYSNAEVFTQCYEGSCYQASASVLNWDDAVSYCNDLDAQLTSIHSSDENNFINENVRVSSTNHLIGLNDIDEEGVYQWVDGTPVNYTNFKAGEPNNFGNREHIGVLTRFGTWNDADQDKTFYAICKKTPTQSPTAIPSISPTSTVSPSFQPTTPLLPSVPPTQSPSAVPTNTEPTSSSISPLALPVEAQSSNFISLSFYDYIILVLAIIGTYVSVIVCFLCRSRSRSDNKNSKVPQDQRFEIEGRGYRMNESDVIPGVIEGKAAQKSNEIQKESEMLLPRNTEGLCLMTTDFKKV